MPKTKSLFKKVQLWVALGILKKKGKIPLVQYKKESKRAAIIAKCVAAIPSAILGIVTLGGYLCYECYAYNHDTKAAAAADAVRNARADAAAAALPPAPSREKMRSNRPRAATISSKGMHLPSMSEAIPATP